MLVRADFNRHALYHSEAIATQADDFLGVVREQSKLRHAQVPEDLRPQSVLPQVSLKTQMPVGFDRIHARVLQFIGADLVAKSDAAAFVPAHVDEHAVAAFGDLPERCLELRPAVASQGS